MDNAVPRRSGLRISNTAFLGWGRKLRVVLKFVGAVIAAAAFAGVLSWLSATTSRPIASPLAKPEEVSLKPASNGLGPISTGLVPDRSERRGFQLLTNDGSTPRAGMFGAFGSDARLLWESSQMQDW